MWAAPPAIAPSRPSEEVSARGDCSDGRPGAWTASIWTPENGQICEVRPRGSITSQPQRVQPPWLYRSARPQLRCLSDDDDELYFSACSKLAALTARNGPQKWNRLVFNVGKLNLHLPKGYCLPRSMVGVSAGPQWEIWAREGSG